MLKKKKIIAWEKWESAIGLDEEVDEDTVEEEEINYENTLPQAEQIIKQTNLITMTPMGTMPIPPYKPENFNFWMGYTNFDITPQIKNIVESTEGVEILDIFTRYRMRIGIGKVFTHGEVMHKINSAVSGYFRGDICQTDQEVK